MGILQGVYIAVFKHVEESYGHPVISNIKEQAHLSLVWPLLEYATTGWFVACTKRDINTIKSVQKHMLCDLSAGIATRVVVSHRYYAH